jgi:hypothetical protein
MRKLWTCVALSLLSATAGQAQLDNWQIGGSGLTWSETDSVQILVDFDRTPGAIQPLYLTPDRTVFSLLENWQFWRDPGDKGLGYVDGQMPRIWKFKDGIPDPSENGSWLIDGDSTSYNIPIAQGGISAEYFTIDVAVPVPAVQFGFFTSPVGFRLEGTPTAIDAPPAFDVSVGIDADAAIPKGGNDLLERVVANVGENHDPTVHIDFPRQYVRFMRWRRQLSLIDEEALSGCRDCGAQGNQARAIKGNIGEFELFAQGIPQRVVYVTRIADLGTIANFGRLHWAMTAMRMQDGIAVEDPDAAVSVKVEVRSGRDEVPDIYHEFTNTGLEKEVGRERYDKELKARFVRTSADAGSFRFREPKPGVRASIKYDSDNWTYWSVPFTESGQPLRLRSGSHLQLTITLESQDFDAWARLDSLWVETAPLLADDVFGEVARADDLQPQRGFTEVELGAMTDFAYDLQAVFTGDQASGFDALRIHTGNRAAFRRLEMGSPLVATDPTEIIEEESALVVHLPERITPAQNQPVRVVFGTEVFEFAATFEGEVFESDSEALPQPIVPGDASDAVSTNSLRVLSSPDASPDFVQGLSFSTPVLTPNGDQVHDQLNIAYSLFRLPEQVPVILEVYALDGRRVARVAMGVQDSGPQQITWDGRDERGQTLAPGLYLISIALETEATQSPQLRPLGIAY